MKTPFVTSTLLSLTLATAASAADQTAPVGFNIETDPDAAPVFGALGDSLILKTGGFGDERLVRLYPDGTLQLFATGFASAAGFAVSPVDGDIVVGESFPTGFLWSLTDLNDDGDALDAGEMAPFVAQPPLSNSPTPEVPVPFDLGYRPGSDELFFSGSTQTDAFGVVLRFADGLWNVYDEGLAFAGNMVFDGDDLYVADSELIDPVFFTFRGRVFQLRDGNADGDALDTDERRTFAEDITGGANGFVRSHTGSFFLATGAGGTVARLAADGDDDGASDEVVLDHIAGFGFVSGLTLSEGPGGLVPGSTGDGELTMTHFVGFDEVRTVVRSAPLATTTVNGTVSANSAFEIVLGGEHDDMGLFFMSLDTTPTTVQGIGDLCFGFGSDFLVSPLLPLGGAGEFTAPLVFHGLDFLVGETLTIQGACYDPDTGRWGLGDALAFTIES